MLRHRAQILTAAVAFATLLVSPAFGQVVSNPLCPDNTAFFNPLLPPSIMLPAGFTASVFASGLNFPTGIAFLGNTNRFEVFVLESGHGLPSPACNDETSSSVGGAFSTANPFTPDILVFNQNGRQIRGPLGKPTLDGGGFSREARLSTSGSHMDLREAHSSRPTLTSRRTPITAQTTARGLSSSTI